MSTIAIIFLLVGVFYILVSFVHGLIFNSEIGEAFSWPTVFIPGHRKRKAFKEGYNDMRRGSLRNPSYGRVDNYYMDHKNEKIFNAYIKGGDKRLDEMFADKAGTSPRKVRESMLESHDKARLEALRAIEEIQNGWQHEYDQLSSTSAPRKRLLGRKRNV